MLNRFPISFAKFILVVTFFYSSICSAGVHEYIGQHYNKFLQTIKSRSSHLQLPTLKQMLVGGITLGTAATAGKFIPLRNMVVGASSVIIPSAAVYAYKYRQHGKQLEIIERTLELSKTAQYRGSKGDFKLCTWRQINSKSNWQTAYDILLDKKAVFKQLMNDVENDALMSINTENKILNKKSMHAIITKAIEKEQLELENYLFVIDNNANIAELFVKKFIHMPELQKTNAMSSLTNHQKICQSAVHLITKCPEKITELISSCKTVERDPYIMMPTYNPFSIIIAPRVAKAIEIYADVFIAYTRLLAIKDAVLDAQAS